MTGQTPAAARCPVCGTPLDAPLEVTTCEACLTPHHRDCWIYNDGCAVYSCPRQLDAAIAHPAETAEFPRSLAAIRTLLIATLTAHSAWFVFHLAVFFVLARIFYPDFGGMYYGRIDWEEVAIPVALVALLAAAPARLLAAMTRLTLPDLKARSSLLPLTEGRSIRPHEARLDSFLVVVGRLGTLGIAVLVLGLSYVRNHSSGTLDASLGCLCWFLLFVGVPSAVLRHARAILATCARFHQWRASCALRHTAHAPGVASCSSHPPEASFPPATASSMAATCEPHRSSHTRGALDTVNKAKESLTS